METLRSGFTPDGQRVFLLFDSAINKYRIATRWAWLASFEVINDACDAFEAIEFMEGDLRPAARIAKAEIARVPRHAFGRGRCSMGRISYLISCVERRAKGFRPVIFGSKGSVEKWVKK